MKGDWVVVRGHENAAAALRVWRDGDEVIEVMADADFQDAEAKGYEVIWPVGVPRQDVYAFEADALDRVKTDPAAWSTLPGY